MSVSLSRQTIDAARRLGSATLHEAGGKIGAFPSGIKPLDSDWRVCGAAFTVVGPALDNLWLHRAIYHAPEGSVLVHECGGNAEAGYWGGIMTTGAMERGLAGLVTEGGVRDRSELISLSFPVFAANVCIAGTTKRDDGTGSVGRSARIGNVLVRTGDLVVADADGVVVLPAAEADRMVRLGIERESKESEIAALLRSGERSLDIYGLPEFRR